MSATRKQGAAQQFDPVFALHGTEDLIRAAECLRWDRIECEASNESEPMRSNGLAFLDLQLASIAHELARRERFRGLPGAPDWPPEPTEERRQFVRDIKDRVTVLDLYEQHFPMQPLRKAGKSWRGRCVFHGGNNPDALSVFNDGRSWYCYNCGAGGDVFTMAGLLYRTTNFPEIADRLAAEFGIEKPAPDYSRNQKPLGESISGIVLKPKKRSFEPFERRNGELVRL